MQSEHDPKVIETLIMELRKAVKTLTNYLMAQEMMVVEQFEDVVKEVEQNYTQLCSTSVEVSRQSFTRFREITNEYHEKVSEVVVANFDKFAKNPDLDQLDEVIREVCLA